MATVKFTSQIETIFEKEENTPVEVKEETPIAIEEIQLKHTPEPVIQKKLKKKLLLKKLL